MAPIHRRTRRLLAVAVVVAGFCMVPPELLARGPNLCLWRRLLHLAACPACGSTRALAAFFHGRWGEAWAYNRNVLVTAPVLMALVAGDAVLLLRKLLGGAPWGIQEGITKH
jgi:hypothetical protein